jgi:hypothetical protein
MATVRECRLILVKIKLAAATMFTSLKMHINKSRGVESFLKGSLTSGQHPPPSMESAGSLLCIQKATTGPYSEPAASSRAARAKRLFHEISL